MAPRQQKQHTTFCLHFRPSPESRLRSINVLPDFLGPDEVEIASVEIDGIKRELKEEDRKLFRVPLTRDDLGRKLVVSFRQADAAYQRRSKYAIGDTFLP